MTPSKIIFAAKDNYVLIQNVLTHEMSKFDALLGLFNYHTKNINEIQINDNFLLALKNGEIVKFELLSQLNDVPSIFSKLFCFIDADDNIYTLAGINIVELGHLEQDGNDFIIKRKIKLPDGKYRDQNFHGDSIQLIETLENDYRLVMHYVMLHNNFLTNVKVGTIESEFIEHIGLSHIKTNSLFDNPIKIEIKCRIDANGKLIT